jgi:hypothetical protein
MQRETEMSFAHVMREDRSLLELIDSDYTFLNETLAELYAIDGVEGDEMRRVELPQESPRGGLLTQGTFLVVTSNPTRTSPVKRGLFILENVLGTPPPPPPPTVPPLEESADAITDHKPTIRELQELHRQDPLCSSCHARMDPLGLALENFNALGMYRETDNDQPIDASGQLLTGEEFDGIRKLKTIIKTEHRLDFYRCVTEKMLTYALGRGLEYHDEHVVDSIVESSSRRRSKRCGGRKVKDPSHESEIALAESVAGAEAGAEPASFLARLGRVRCAARAAFIVARRALGGGRSGAGRGGKSGRGRADPIGVRHNPQWRAPGKLVAQGEREGFHVRLDDGTAGRASR